MATHTLIFNGDDENTRRCVEGLASKTCITFGLGRENRYRADNIVLNRGAFPQFDVFVDEKKAGTVRLNIPGMHNVLNSLAAIAAACNAGVGMDACICAIEQFTGAGRRFEMLGKYAGVTIVDDYAHHPAELRVTLEAASKMEYKEVWAVFQPFTFSRTYLLMEDFAEVLRIPQHTVMTEIMGSREINTYDVYTAQLAEKIPGSVWFNTFEEIADYIVAHAKPGDLVLTLGCGDIYKAAKLMIQKYQSRAAQV